MSFWKKKIFVQGVDTVQQCGAGLCQLTNQFLEIIIFEIFLTQIIGLVSHTFLVIQTHFARLWRQNGSQVANDISWVLHMEITLNMYIIEDAFDFVGFCADQ